MLPDTPPAPSGAAKGAPSGDEEESPRSVLPRPLHSATLPPLRVPPHPPHSQHVSETRTPSH